MGIPGGSVVKNPPDNAGDTVQSVGEEDPLEKVRESIRHSVVSDSLRSYGL